MKISKQCTKCRSPRIGVATAYDGKMGERIIARYRNAYYSHPFDGTVQAWICADCGFFEEYVERPQQQPWGKLEIQWLREEDRVAFGAPVPRPPTARRNADASGSGLKTVIGVMAFCTLFVAVAVALALSFT